MSKNKMICIVFLTILLVLLCISSINIMAEESKRGNVRIWVYPVEGVFYIYIDEKYVGTYYSPGGHFDPLKGYLEVYNIREGMHKFKAIRKDYKYEGWRNYYVHSSNNMNSFNYVSIYVHLKK